MGLELFGLGMVVLGRRWAISVKVFGNAFIFLISVFLWFGRR